MDNLIKTYDDILDSQTCNNIIGKFEQFENQHEEFDDKGMIFTQIRMAKSPQIWSKEDKTIYKCFSIISFNIFNRHRCYTTTDAK